MSGCSSTKLSQPESQIIVSKKAPIQVECRINFTKIGEIDSKNEKFTSEAFIECVWNDDDLLKAIIDPKTQILNNINEKELLNLEALVNKIKFDPEVNWSPEIYVKNSIGDPKETIKHSIKLVRLNRDNSKNISAKDLTIKVFEKRKIEGEFYERLELHDFPIDLQEISIKLTSKKSVNEVVLVENKLDYSAVNTDNFADQQQWDLLDHVKLSSDTVEDKWRKCNCSQFIVSSFVVRKIGFYLYNAFLLIFLITAIGFATFSISPITPQFRCQVTGLLLLTSVNFRWIITQRLPSVSYLTILDKYGIGCLFYLALIFVWHSIIGSKVITSDTVEMRKIDEYFLYASASVFAVFNFVFIIWFSKLAFSIGNFKKENKREGLGSRDHALNQNNKDIEIFNYE